MIFLLLVTIVLFIIGLFAPQVSLFWYNKERKRAVSILIYGGLLIVLACLMPASEHKNDQSTLAAQPASGINQTEHTAEADTVVSVAVANDPATVEANRVRRKLRAKAEQDWPNDYSTQEYWINQEMEDYAIMLAVPDNAIKRQAERDWPYDFSTQKYWYQEQIAAKERLNGE